MEIARCVRRFIPAWMKEMERFFELVVFNYIYANGDAHLKNFSVILIDGDYQLSPAYDLMNTALHVHDMDFALEGGLSPDMLGGDSFLRTGHPCRKDFEWFGKEVGLVESRVRRILDMYMTMPDAARELVEQSSLPEKLRRSYLRISNERISRFVRESQI